MCEKEGLLLLGRSDIWERFSSRMVSCAIRARWVGISRALTCVLIVKFVITYEPEVHVAEDERVPQPLTVVTLLWDEVDS